MGAASSLRGLLVLGVVFHAIYVLSIFDIYFKSPVVPHIESLAYTDAALPAPAKRVVVFVADGCRADKFFERNATTDANAPRRVSFLRDVIEQRGSWGVSHTRVPTESRPGHVALFAGMYEDVSAVTKGWQDNPVDFDSIFNQSQHSWLFGSPDIVPMFARRVAQATEAHYSHEEEDFAKEASELDVWVFERMRKLLMEAAAANITLNAELRGSQVLFFCHFLGIDTNGHAHRPNSGDYLNNIALVDELVEKVHQMIEDFYDYDGATAYVFTADHGMSNKGAHGDGDPANTRTPLVVWGAGVETPQRVETSARFEIDLPTQSRAQVAAQLDAQGVQEATAMDEWGLAHLKRKDVMQADVAPLISSLLGLPYPRNSVGVLPFTYLAQGRYRAKAVMSNAQQLYLHALRKEQEKEAQTLLWFRPYAPFRDAVPRLRKEMQASWEKEDLARVEALSQEMIAICLDTLEYFQRYDWFFLLSVIVLGYLGWMGVLAVAFLASESPSSVVNLRTLLFVPCDARFIAFSVVCSAFLALESSPWTYYVYLSFPLLYWNSIRAHRHVLSVVWSSATSTQDRQRRGLELVFILASLELVVVGYMRRWLFGVVFTLLALLPVLERSSKSSSSSSSWSIACLVLSVFPYLSTEYGDHTALVSLGGVVLLALVWTWLRQHSASPTSLSWIGIRALPLLLSLVAVHATMYFLDNKLKPPTALTLLNWLLALAPVIALIVLPASPSSSSSQRLVEIALAVAPAYVLLSISYEVLFFAALTGVVLAWIELEATRSSLSSTSSSWDALRRAFVFLLLIKIAFFGTGNVASMSSFELSSTYRFVTIFAPFLMGTLLVLKILLPFLVVACAFRMLVSSTAASTRYFLVVVGLSDVLALHFLFLVRNEGSWKEIGNSISMFGIVNAQIVFVPLLFLLARVVSPTHQTHSKTY
ncbi:hypothetical protein Poli38472_007165 [Pythium oligandrum]|uniref:GPI ethanolamine phosphate transferase 1 n=1 Tax=Pythium oligandrum TaxID=41045 RepID=A0A8K1C9L0_PYTOL|nr:hypothetical protein Poli38472_007165 [Pythium oligandrum]|eukprot:TMW59020.1 hypothetical protein Poli38472_007165 [Pythium oligandrum]